MASSAIGNRSTGEPPACDPIGSARQRGSREPATTGGPIAPLVGRPLELVTVPLRSEVLDRDGDLVAGVADYAAEVLAAAPAIRVTVDRRVLSGVLDTDGQRWWVRLTGSDELPALGLGAGDRTDVTLRAGP